MRRNGTTEIEFAAGGTDRRLNWRIDVMKDRKTYRQKNLGIAGCITAASLFGLILQPANAYTILAPGAVVAGKSIADWTADWWTWSLQAPLAANPLSDTTGASANQNNNGPVFFIAGNTATRNFDVPAGRPILLPMINLFDVESVPPDPPTATLGDRMTAVDLVVQAWLNAVDTGSLFASIDGNAVVNPANYLEVTGYFDMGPTQAGSLLESFGLPAGTDAFPTKSGGYWLMLDGLAPGLHELHFGGASDGWSVDTGTPIGIESLGPFSTDTTDFINVVVPEPASAFLLFSGLAALLALCRRPTDPV
jgi:hypothetical protein